MASPSPWIGWLGAGASHQGQLPFDLTLQVRPPGCPTTRVSSVAGGSGVKPRRMGRRATSPRIAVRKACSTRRLPLMSANLWRRGTARGRASAPRIRLRQPRAADLHARPMLRCHPAQTAPPSLYAGFRSYQRRRLVYERLIPADEQRASRPGGASARRASCLW